MLSKTKIDQLGERLKSTPITEADLRLLDEYRRQCEPAMTRVMQVLQEGFRLQPSARPAKSTIAIVEKLRRESIRLSQIQDIAGCRLVVRNIAEQRQLAEVLSVKFTTAQVFDRTVQPSFGYRAIHLIVRVDSFRVEIQVRTLLQHLWAQLSEVFADRLGSEIKYGGGDEGARQLLSSYSKLISDYEALESEIPASALLQLVHPSRERFHQIRQVGVELINSIQEDISELHADSDRAE
jgi:putative GTP pyrophosphokinase